MTGLSRPACTGSMTDLTAEMLRLDTGIEMTHVVYRGGTPAPAGTPPEIVAKPGPQRPGA